MRQPLDKIITYDACGDFYDPLVTPSSLATNAICEYVARRAATQTEKERGGVGTPRGFRPDLVVEALGDINMLLKNTSVMMAVAKILFASGNSDYVWRDRDFLATREALFTALALRTTATAPPTRAATAMLIAEADESQRRVLVDVALAIWSEFGIVTWRQDLHRVSSYKSLIVSYKDIPYLVAESKLRRLELLRAVRPAGTRVMFGAAYAYMQEAARALAQQVNAIATTTHFAERIVDAVTHVMNRPDPAIPRAPFEPLLSCVNFMLPGQRTAEFSDVGALVIAPMVPELVSAISDAPHVKVRSMREYTDMYDIRHVFSQRTRQPVLTTVTRRYAMAKANARLLDVTDATDLGISFVESAAEVSSIPALDETVDAVMDLVNADMVNEALSMLSEGDATRVLISPVPRDELAALAACISGEIAYSSTSADRAVAVDLTFVFHLDPVMTGWEDQIIEHADGIALSREWSTVLRLSGEKIGAGTYPVAHGINELLSGSPRSAILGEVKRAWTGSGTIYELELTVPVYVHDPIHGMRVDGTKRHPASISMSALSLLNIAPLRSHALSLNPEVRLRLSERAAWAALALELCTSGSELRSPQLFHAELTDLGEYLEEPDRPMTVIGSPTTTTLFRQDDVGAARRGAVYAQMSIMYIDAILRFMTSRVARVAHSQMVLRAGARSQKPLTTDEARAYIHSVESYMVRFLIPFLRIPESYVDVLQSLRGTASFERLSIYTVLHPASFK